MEKVALGEIFLQVLRFSLVTVIPPAIRTYLFFTNVIILSTESVAK
jgi:hypothetical protein